MTRSRDWFCAPSSCANADRICLGGKQRLLIRHTSPFTRAVPPRVMTMHVSRSPVHSRAIGRGTDACHVSNDCLAAADKARLRAPFGGLSRTTPVLLRHRTARLAQELALPVASMSTPRHPSLDCHGFAVAGVVGTITPALRSGLQLVTRAPAPFSAPRRTIFCTGPMAGLCVVSPSPAPVPPRRIAMRCSQGGTGVILSQVSGTGKNGVRRLNSIRNRRAFV